MTEIIKHLPYGFHRVEPPNLIIVHAMGEYIDTNDDNEDRHAVDFLRSIGLSAHALVAPDGTLYRCRLDTEGAYHAKGFNKTSLGIEFLVPGCHTYGTFVEAIKKEWVSPVQYVTGMETIRQWVKEYSIIDMQRHSDVSPGRKVDPGEGFPWKQLRYDIYGS